MPRDDIAAFKRRTSRMKKQIRKTVGPALDKSADEMVAMAKSGRGMPKIGVDSQLSRWPESACAVCVTVEVMVGSPWILAQRAVSGILARRAVRCRG